MSRCSSEPIRWNLTVVVEALGKSPIFTDHRCRSRSNGIDTWGMDVLGMETIIQGGFTDFHLENQILRSDLPVKTVQFMTGIHNPRWKTFSNIARTCFVHQRRDGARSAPGMRHSLETRSQHQHSNANPQTQTHLRGWESSRRLSQKDKNR